jgi:3-oxoacyl-[acyl-carrier protein] reductase
MKSLEGRVALITGAGRGLGAATAERLAGDGAGVVLVDLDAESCQQVLAGLDGTEGLALACDVTNTAQVQETIDRTLERFGRLDILVNNAGILRDNLLFKMSDDDWDQVIAVHLRGAFLCSRAAQKPMVQQKHGRIINLSSVSALGNRGQANYSAAKAGLQGFTRTLSLELGPFGITANAVAPGAIETAMTHQLAHQLNISFEQLAANMSQKIALRRVGQPSEVAGVIAFLASDDASYVSGQVIYVAGGPGETLV